jgi:hypothetical protein
LLSLFYNLFWGGIAHLPLLYQPPLFERLNAHFGGRFAVRFAVSLAGLDKALNLTVPDMKIIGVRRWSIRPEISDRTLFPSRGGQYCKEVLV